VLRTRNEKAVERNRYASWRFCLLWGLRWRCMHTETFVRICNCISRLRQAAGTLFTFADNNLKKKMKKVLQIKKILYLCCRSYGLRVYIILSNKKMQKMRSSKNEY